MEKKNFLRFLLAIVTAIFSLTGCSDHSVFGGDTPSPNPDPNPDGEDKISLVDGSLNIKHDWKYSNTLVSDVVTSMATLEHDNGETIKEEKINQLLPFEIKWSQPNEMTRGTKVFTLHEKNFGQSVLTATENNDNIVLKTYEQDFSFLFDGVELKFETSYQTDSSKYEGINLANCILDSIVYRSQEAETLERYFVGDRPFLKSKVTFTFDVCRHHTHDNTTHTDKIYPYVIVSAPEKVEPGEDIFNGAVIIAGSEKLFYNKEIDKNTKIYTSQVDVWEFWTVSGKKRVTYSTDLEIKQWIDDAKEAWKVPHIEFGYPNFKKQAESTSEDYTKAEVSDYVFQKTTSDWIATWSYANNYQIGVYGSSEKAWKTYLGAKIVEMPSSLHEFFYDKYTYSDYTEKVIDGKTYLSYPSLIYFNALYNGDTYPLNQSQEFLVEKDGNQPPAPKDSIISEKILYKLEKNNEKWISTIIFHRTYQESGERDSIATQELQRITKIDDDKRFVRENNTLNLKNTLEPVTVSENTETDKTTGHVITTTVKQHAFDFYFFTFNIEETYQTAYTVYKGERLYFQAPVPSVVLSGQTPKDMGSITDADGTKYNRTEYTLSFKETYGNYNAMYYPLINIDVKDDSKPETDEIIGWSFDRERKKTTSQIILHITKKLSGTKDSILTAYQPHGSSISSKQSFYCTDNTLSLAEALTPSVKTSQETKEGITYVTTIKTYRFLYNITNIDGRKYYDEIKTSDVTAFITFQGTKIDFLAPEMSTITYSGSTPADKGEVTGAEGQKYNLTTYTHAYKELYDGQTQTLNSEVDLYVKPAEVIRDSWEVRNEGLVRINDTQWRSFFTLYEKFSNGTEKNTEKEALLNVYVQAPAKRNLQLNSAEFKYNSLKPKSSSVTTRTEGANITVTTTQMPYDLVYTNTENEAVSSEFVFVSETAVYKDGDIVVNFKSADWSNIKDEGYSAPLQGLVGEYNRYNAEFNISGEYNGVTYPATALVDVDVLAPVDPTIPPEWGDIDIEKTSAFGRICVTWKEVAGQTKLQHFYSGTILTTKGIISFSKDYKKFTAMDTNIITTEVGNGWDGANLNPAYINVSTDPNISWQYFDVITNNPVADIHSSKMQTEGGIDLNKPFVANGGNASVYKIIQNGERTTIIVTYNGEELFRETF